MNNKKPFGNTVAWFKVTPFQKRRLPRTVILFLNRLSRQMLGSLQNVDRIVSPEIPGYEEPHLQDSILKHIVHNPCGYKNPAAVCVHKSDNPRARKANNDNNNNSFNVNTFNHERLSVFYRVVPGFHWVVAEVPRYVVLSYEEVRHQHCLVPDFHATRYSLVQSGTFHF